MSRNIVRRDFVRAGSIAAATVAFGGVSTCLAGCQPGQTTASDASANPAPSVRVADGKFYVNGAKEGIAYFGDALHLYPDAEAGKLCVGYRGSEGGFASEPVCDYGEEITVDGTCGMLTADSAASDAVVRIAPASSLAVLGVGAVGKAKIEGAVDTVLVPTSADLEVEAGAKIGRLVLGDTLSDAEIKKGAQVESTQAPFIGQYSGDGFDQAGFEAVAEDEAIKLNGDYLDIARGKTDASGETSATANPFAPQKAYAAEAGEQEEAEGDAGTDGEDIVDGYPEVELPPSSPYASIDPEEGADEEGDADLVAFPPANAGSDVIIEDILIDGLKKLGKAALDKGLDYGKKSFMSIVFGEGEQKDGITRRLEEISDKVDEINAKLSQLIKMFKDEQYSKQLDSYAKEWGSKANAAISSFRGTLDDVDESYPDDEAKRKKAREAFADGIILATNSNYLVGSMPVYQYLSSLRDQICDPWNMTSTVLVEAYDDLCILRYRWEHQAYDLREDFHDCVASQFLELATYYLVAARTFLEAHADDYETLSDPLAYSRTRKGLESMFGKDAFYYGKNDGDEAEMDDADPNSEGLNGDVFACLEKHAVVRRPDDERRLQTEGCELTFLASTALVKTRPEGKKSQTQFMRDAAGNKAIDEQAIAKLKRAFGSDFSSLDQALFSEDEGNIARTEGTEGVKLFALSKPVDVVKKVSADAYSTTTFYKYSVFGANGKGDVSKNLFCEVTQRDSGSSTKWHEIPALAVFVKEWE